MIQIIEVEGGFKVIVSGDASGMQGPTYTTRERADQVYLMACKAANQFMTGAREMPSIYEAE